MIDDYSSCWICGCDELTACEGGCSWIDCERTVCSQCFRSFFLRALRGAASVRFSVTRLRSDFEINDTPTNRQLVAREALAIAKLKGVPLKVSGLPKEDIDRLLLF